MGMALNKSTDGGTTFQQVSVDVADYTVTDHSNSRQVTADKFCTIKDSANNTYILATKTGCYSDLLVLKIDKNGTLLNKSFVVPSESSGFYSDNWNSFILSRDESYIFMNRNRGNAYQYLYIIPLSQLGSGNIITITAVIAPSPSSSSMYIAIYRDQYIWVASGTTVKIYNYDTKAELASDSVDSSSKAICLDENNELYILESYIPYNFQDRIYKFTFNGINIINRSIVFQTSLAPFSNAKQLLIDRFGDLIILTNTGTASTLLKYSNTGTLIDTVNLSVGTNKGAYGLQVYSSDNGTKCWVQFSNDLGTWRTAETTAQGQVFGVVSKIRNNGVTVYGDDHGGDNNYSVWCP